MFITLFTNTQTNTQSPADSRGGQLYIIHFKQNIMKGNEVKVNRYFDRYFKDTVFKGVFDNVLSE